MKVRVENSGPCRRILHVEVDQAVADAEYENVTREYTKVAELPGFRKGKAPAQLVGRRFEKQIVGETSDRLVPKWYREALAAEKIEAVDVVDVSDVSFIKGQPFRFRVTVDIPPKFRLPKYKGLSVDGKKVDVADSDVDAALGRLRDQFARFEDAAADRALATGDMAQVDYKGVCDGTPLAAMSADLAMLGAAKDFWIFLGGRELIPGFARGREDRGKEGS